MNTPAEEVSETHDLITTHVVPNYGRYPIAPVRGQGPWLWDEGGRKFLDFGGGIAVCSLGHCHPRMVKALQAQASTLIHCSNLYEIPGQGRLARLLNERIIQLEGKCFFCNSGAEANEALYKLARRYGHLRPIEEGRPRYEILTFNQGFHGRSLAGIAATAQEKVKTGFAPVLPGFRHLPFNDVETLEQSIQPETVAILVEPMQGEGGINIASPQFLKTIARLCKEHDLLLMFDEIQCGVGRLGELRGWEVALGETAEEAGVIPDAVSWAKGIAGGFPFGASWIRKRHASSDVMLCDLLGPGSHGTTYGGSPLSCAVATAVVEEILEKDLSANSRVQGEWILEQLNSMDLPLISEARGKGLMIGLVIDQQAMGNLPDFTSSKLTPSVYLYGKLNESGLLSVPAGAGIIRWLPPLNITRGEAETAIFMLKTALERLTSRF